MPDFLPFSYAVNPVHASSAIQANANAVATMPAVAGKTNYVSGVIFTGSGATGAFIAGPNIVGLLGGTATFVFPVVAGVTLGNPPLVLTFNPPLPASAQNVALVATLPALGAGNTAAQATIYGFVI